MGSCNATQQPGGANATADDADPPPCLKYPVPAAAAIALAIAAVWVLVVLGNLLVILAIWLDKKINGVQNWFLASLALADLLLGLLVMPFSLSNQLLNVWVFGRRWCELWLAIDVLMCTASITHLCLISLDRYWSVSQALTYPQSRTKRRAVGMMATVWLLSAMVCLPPLLGWRKPQAREAKCELTSDPGYVLYSSIASFYIPMLIMLIVYVRIFLVARRRAQRRRGHQQHGDGPAVPRCELPLRPLDADGTAAASSAGEETGDRELRQAMRKQRQMARSKERRATVIVGLIVGAFIACWLPFFTTYLADTFCRCVPHLLFDFFFWLGYCNSALNPVIYTLFNRDFRKAFKRLLTCSGRRRYR